HFVGDIHQPLHDVDNNDRGGNCTAIQFFTEDKPINLHAIWDYKLIEHRIDQQKSTQPQYAAALNEGYATRFDTLSSEKPDDPDTWAWQTHALADSVTYGNLSPAIPVETPNPQADCNAERDKVAALHIRIDDDYFSKAMPVIDKQLATAGYRLADLL